MIRKFLSAIALVVTPFAASADDVVDFNLQIRPILNNKCIKCHGGVKEAGELNLQFRDEALKAGKSGKIAIVPGKPEESEFFKRITHHDEEERMPKDASALTSDQIDLVKRWIASGANWAEHWAYQNPVGSGKTVDEMVLAKLKKEDLTFSPEAKLSTLARRISFDVVGLPPSPERVEALEKAAATDKEAALRGYIDELLASPAYGEKWSAPWLDLARYADSNGYEADRFRDMWPWRDWVVASLNNDMPYDEFLIEQLAGDLMPNATESQIVATGFHRNTTSNDEGGTDNEEFRTYAVLDRLNVTFDALQGTSMGCVQCHGHPYDAFVHKEYYELLAFFNNTADADLPNLSPTMPAIGPIFGAKLKSLQKTIAIEQKAVAESTANIKPAFENWLTVVSSQALPSHEFRDLKITATAGVFEKQADGHFLLKGAAPEHSTMTVSGTSGGGKLTHISLQALHDPTLPKNGPGTSADAGNFILTHISLHATIGGVEKELPLARAEASYSQTKWPVAEALTRNSGPEDKIGWAVAGNDGSDVGATFHLAEPLDLPVGTPIKITLECENTHWTGHILGSFSVTASGGAELTAELASLPDEVKAILTRPRTTWSAADLAVTEGHFIRINAPQSEEHIAHLKAAQTELASMPKANLPIMTELPDGKKRVTKLFHRGNWMDQTEVVEPATPRILNPWPEGEPRNRLGLAHWLTNGENPLTARVQVNRVWEQIFGIGLVETLEDFGSQGDKPIFQNVLDELALRFQGEMKWSQKDLLREILMTQTYRQSSKTESLLREKDPYNRLLARGPRFRLSNEQIRDQALSLAGILSTKMGGPGVMPYQPPGTWLVPYEGKNWEISPGEDSRRRALYTFIRRSATYPSMVTFDAPNREFCLVRRTLSNTPLQALDGLNSPVFIEAAEGLAGRMEGATIEEKVAKGILLATQRPARAYEIEILSKLYADTDKNLVLVANSILNLDEVLNKN